jgi:hypothetical protein
MAQPIQFGSGSLRQWGSTPRSTGSLQGDAVDEVVQQLQLVKSFSHFVQLCLLFKK